MRRGRFGVVGVAGEAGLTVMALWGEAGKLPALPSPLLLSLSRSLSRSRSRLVGVLSKDPELVISLSDDDGGGGGVGGVGGGDPEFDLRRCGGTGGGVGGLFRFSATLKDFFFNLFYDL